MVRRRGLNAKGFAIVVPRLESRETWGPILVVLDRDLEINPQAGAASGQRSCALLLQP